VSLKTPVRPHDIRTDYRIFSFLTGHQYRKAAEEMPLDEKIAFIRQAIRDKAALAITYLKADDTKTTRKVIPLKVGPATYKGKDYEGMKAYCTVRQEERMFRVDRILRLGRAGR
jgi:predicted DNA-binding transcriptional regulator YafY